MNYWLITDTHFNHRKLEEYSGRPADFEQKIFDNCKRLVKKGDMLIHLGDVCIGKDSEMLAKYWMPLEPFRVLVKGNHDKKSSSWYFDHGFEFVCDSFSIKYGGHKILFTHIPKENPHGYSLNIHGHFHNNDHRMDEEIMKYYNPRFHKLLAIENTDYAPVRLDAFLDKVLGRNQKAT